MFASIPAIVFAGYVFTWSIKKKDLKDEKSYTKAGGLAEQALTAIRTIKMLNGENWEVEKYKKCLF